MDCLWSRFTWYNGAQNLFMVCVNGDRYTLQLLLRFDSHRAYRSAAAEPSHRHHHNHDRHCLFCENNRDAYIVNAITITLLHHVVHKMRRRLTMMFIYFYILLEYTLIMMRSFWKLFINGNACRLAIRCFVWNNVDLGSHRCMRVLVTLHSSKYFFASRSINS